MADPNLINVTSCILDEAIGGVGTTATTLVTYTNNKLKKIVSIYFCNTTASTQTISMYDSNPGTNRYYLKDVDIPSKSTLVAVTKDAPLHFGDSTHSLVAIASATGVDFVINWEEYDDA